MKIVHCLFAFETGGAQILSIDLMNAMCVEHEVSLIVVNDLVNPKLVKQLDKKIKVFFINRREGSKNPWPIIRLNLLLFGLKPDVIHCHEPKMAGIIKLTKAKLLQTVHDVGISTDNYDLYKVSVAISDAVYNDVISRYKKERVEKIYNGINFELFNKRNEYSLKPNEPIRLVQLSRLMHEKKGQVILLKALIEIKKSSHQTAFTLDFIGTGDSQQYLEQMIADLGLQKEVTIRGERSREWLFENLASYHILIQPSIYEGFGLTILEGFAAGLPVLASNIDGPAEIIRGLDAGFLFDNGDVNGCADKLAQMFDLYGHNEFSNRMVQTLAIVNQKYSIQVSAKTYLALYSRLCGFGSISNN